MHNINNDNISIWTVGALEIRKISIVDNATDILELIKIGRKLNRFYTHSCNGYNYEKYDKLAKKWENKAREIAKRMRVYIYFQTDPRGGTIYIDTKPIPDNNYIQAVFIA